MRADWKVSARRACGVLRFDPKSYRYRSRRPGQAPLEKRIKEICQTRVRYGYRRVHVMLRREGWVINEKKTRRVYNEMGMQLRCKTPKRRVKAALRADRTPPSRSNEVWAMDFVHDQTADLDVGPFDDHKDHHVGRAVGLDQFLLQRAVLEEPSHRRQSIGRNFRAARRRSAERRHQREVVRDSDQGSVSVDVAAHECRVGFRGTRRFVATHASRFGVVGLEAPLPLGRFQLNAVASMAAMMDLGLAWLFDVLAKTEQAGRKYQKGSPPRQRKPNLNTIAGRRLVNFVRRCPMGSLRLPF